MIKIPRIIGAVLIAFAALAIYMGSTVAIFFVLAGLILLLAKSKPSEQNFKLFKSSFKSSIFVCALVDTLNLVGFFGILLGAAKYLEKSAALALESTDVTALESALAVKQNLAAAQSFFTSLIIVVIISAIVFFVLYAITRFIIWKLMGYRRPVWKFLLLNLIWWVIWLPIFALVFMGTRPEVAPYLFAIVLFFYLYLTFFVHYSYFNRLKIVKDTLQSAFSNKFLVPLAYAFTLFVVASQAVRVHLVAGAIVLMVWLCWARYYFSIVVKKR
ncbi:hypothetical protein KY329_01895 [Candidatus Woesearchaeota archaeon]|nr:hypothetical protein [Candidatus Woesearchaeota archaeon]